MKQLIKKIPFVGDLARSIYVKVRYPDAVIFSTSHDYWNERYESGRDSGDGSYGELATFKAEVINGFVAEHNIQTVIEFGCGDGNQLLLAEYPRYLGFDISPAVIKLCQEKFSGDDSKQFVIQHQYQGQRADLTLSLDVIYHLVENDVYEAYLRRLFDASDQYVLVYSSNTDEVLQNSGRHVKHRKFTDWVAANRSEWVLEQEITNKFPYDGNNATGSYANFYIFSKAH